MLSFAFLHAKAFRPHLLKHHFSFSPLLLKTDFFLTLYPDYGFPHSTLPSSSSPPLPSRATPLASPIRKQTGFEEIKIQYDKTKNHHIKVGENKQKKKNPRKGTRSRNPLFCTLKNLIKTPNWKDIICFCFLVSNSILDCTHKNQHTYFICIFLDPSLCD